MPHLDITLPIREPVLIIALVMLVVLLAPLLFARLRVPGMVGLIVAGIIIGPHTLNLLERGLTIRVLGTIGLLYIMFLAGLEVNLNDFSKYRKRSISFGALSFLFPQICGTMIAHLLLGFDWPTSILFGSVMASHTLLAYPIISRLGIGKTQAVTVAVGATMLSDTLALLTLAVVAGSQEGNVGATFWVMLTISLAVYTTLLLWGLPKLARWFFRTVRAGEIEDFVFVLAAVFTCSFLAEVAGVEAIIGAFLSGLAMNRLIPEHSALMNRLRFVGESMFIPFFLISVGMLVDVRVLFGGARAWLVAGSMVGTVVITKWATSMLSIPMYKYSRDEAWMLMGLTVPQAAAALGVVLVGFRIGLFSEDVLNGTILTILVTCLLGPWLAERHGRRIARRADLDTAPAEDAHPRILVPLSNPETAPMLMDLAMLIQEHAGEQPIYVLNVTQDGVDVEQQVARSEKLLSLAVMHAASAAVPVVPTTRIDLNVASGISRAAREHRITTLVMGWNGEISARKVIFGSVLDQLLEETRQRVVVAHVKQPYGTLRRVVLAVPPYMDRDAGFAESLGMVKLLASRIGCDLHVIAPDLNMESVRERFAWIKPDVRIDYQPLSNWSDLPRALELIVTSDDLLVLLGARERTVAWHPALNRLPRLLLERLPSANLLVTYPPEVGFKIEGAPIAGEILPPLTIDTKILQDGSDATPRETLSQLLRPVSQSNPELWERSLQALSGMSPEDPPELIPGVVLYHAHVSGLQRPMLFAAISRTGVRMPSGTQPAHVVLAMVSPEEAGPDVHLRALAEVARMFRVPGVVAELCSAETEDQVRRMLAAGLARMSPTQEV